MKIGELIETLTESFEGSVLKAIKRDVLKYLKAGALKGIRTLKGTEIGNSTFFNVYLKKTPCLPLGFEWEGSADSAMDAKCKALEALVSRLEDGRISCGQKKYNDFVS